MTRRPRALREEERLLWDEVRRTARPLAPQRPAHPEAPADTAGAATPPPKPTRRNAQPHGAAIARPQTTAPAPNPRMDFKTWRKLGRGRLEPDAALDLHGMTASQAHAVLTRFIAECHSRDRRLVLIVTGKGRPGDGGDPLREAGGVLRHQVPHWLGASHLRPFILEVVGAHARHGGEGAIYVYLRRRR